MNEQTKQNSTINIVKQKWNPNLLLLLYVLKCDDIEIP